MGLLCVLFGIAEYRDAVPPASCAPLAATAFLFILKIGAVITGL